MKEKMSNYIDYDEKNDNTKNTYPKIFFKLFGAGKDLDIEEPKDLDVRLDGEIEPLDTI